MSSYEAPPAPDYAAASVAGVEADASTLPFRLAISQAAQQGKIYTDPETGKTYDFTGLGYQDQNAAAVQNAKDLMAAGSQISLDSERARLKAELELLPEFNKLNLDQQQSAIDMALAASGKFTENTLQQNLDYLPKLGAVQRTENEAAFNQNLELGKKGTYETAQWQMDLLPQLNKVYSDAQAATYAAAGRAGRAENPTAYATRDTLGQQITDELAKGGEMTPAQQRRYLEQVRGAQATRGNMLGDSAAFDEALQLTSYGDDLAQQRKTNALSFINSRDLSPTFQTIAAVNPLMPNYGATQTITPSVPAMQATTTSGPNLSPSSVQANPLAFLNPSASQQGTSYAQNAWSTTSQINSQQVDPWMAGLGLGFQGLGAAGGIAGLAKI